MKKWNLVFDAAKCTGCSNCTVAVQDEYIGNTFPGYAAEMPRHGKAWVEIRRNERGSFPVVDVAYQFHACQHCDAAPCVAAARDGGAYKRPDGIVVIDPIKAHGQKQIADACPYGAVAWNEALQLPQHWNFDAHLIDAGWLQPRVAQACPAGALTALKVEDDEMRRLVESEGLRTLRPELGLRPRIHYRNLDRFEKAFVAGAIVETVAGVEECARDVTVRLSRDSVLVSEVVSDAFGDFLIDGLSADGARYTVECVRPGILARSIEFELFSSLNLGDIRLGTPA